MPADLPDPVRQFIARHIHSVEQLEILLLLQRTLPREWSAEAVSREISTSRYSAETRLMDLRARGLATMREEGQVLYFSYQPASPDHMHVTQLSGAYAERRTSIITLIFSKPTDSITIFA